jgi:hypothetical protein
MMKQVKLCAPPFRREINLCKDVNEYEEVALEIKKLLETRLGEFSSKNFSEVAKMLGFQLLPLEIRSTFNEYYAKLSDEDRAVLDFMMHM